MSESIVEDVYRQALEIHQSGKTCTRELLTAALNVAPSVLDWNIRRLVDSGRVVRLTRGVYRPIVETPVERATSVTETDDGMVKIEIGDFILECSRIEAGKIGKATIGFAIARGF